MKKYKEIKRVLIKYKESITDEPKKKRLQSLIDKIDSLQEMDHEDGFVKLLVDEIKNIKTPDYLKTFEKLTSQIDGLKELLEKIDIAKEVSVNNFPKQEKVEFPKEIKVSNFPAQKGSIRINNLGDINFPKKMVSEDEYPESINIDRDNTDNIVRVEYRYTDKTVTAIILRTLTGAIRKITYILSS